MLLEGGQNHDPYRVEIRSPYYSVMQLCDSFTILILKCFQVGEVSQLDLTTAENLVEKLESGHATIKNKLGMCL